MSAAESLLSLRRALEPLVAFATALDLRESAAAQRALQARFPLTDPAMRALRAEVRRGVQEGWLCDREAGGLRFSRVAKASDEQPWSIDAVHMQGPGPGHTHPGGEIDLCFAVEGEPAFDGHPEGFTVYPPGSWHVPSVSGGSMDILYLLPGGAIAFGPRPSGPGT